MTWRVMCGNGWEWVADWYDPNYYQASPSRNPNGPERGQYRVLRGGSWRLNPIYARAATRHRSYPDNSDDVVGVRCAKAP